jgi:hypothetical protein
VCFANFRFSVHCGSPWPGYKLGSSITGAGEPGRHPRVEIPFGGIQVSIYGLEGGQEHSKPA